MNKPRLQAGRNIAVRSHEGFCHCPKCGRKLKSAWEEIKMGGWKKCTPCKLYFHIRYLNGYWVGYRRGLRQNGGTQL